MVPTSVHDKGANGVTFQPSWPQADNSHWKKIHFLKPASKAPENRSSNTKRKISSSNFQTIDFQNFCCLFQGWYFPISLCSYMIYAYIDHPHFKQSDQVEDVLYDLLVNPEFTFIWFNSMTHSFSHNHGSVQIYPKNERKLIFSKFQQNNKKTQQNHDCGRKCKSPYLPVIHQKVIIHHACTPTSTAASSPTAMSWVPATLPPTGSPTSWTSSRHRGATNKNPAEVDFGWNPGCLILRNPAFTSWGW